MKLLIQIITLLLMTATHIHSQIIVTRLTPGEKHISEQKKVVFSLIAESEIGLASLEWAIGDKLIKKSILTGYSNTAKWIHNFDKSGIYYVSATIKNIQNESQNLLWSIIIQDRSDIFIISQNPSKSTLNCQLDSSYTFELNFDNSNCDLAQVEWYLDELLIEKSYFLNDKKIAAFNIEFDEIKNHQIIAKTYNLCGGEKAIAWKVNAYKSDDVIVQSVTSTTDIEELDSFRPSFTIGVYGGYFISTVEDFETVYEEKGGIIYGGEISIPLFWVNNSSAITLYAGFSRFEIQGNYLSNNEQIETNWEQNFILSGLRYWFYNNSAFNAWLGLGGNYSMLKVTARSESTDSTPTSNWYGFYGELGCGIDVSNNFGFFINSRYSLINSSSISYGGLDLTGGIKILF